MRETGGSGGNSVSAAFGTVPRGDSQSMAFRLMKNETATTAIATRAILTLVGWSLSVWSPNVLSSTILSPNVLRPGGRSIVPPD